MRLIFTSAALLAPYMGVGPMMFGTIDSTPRCAATSSSHRLCDGYLIDWQLAQISRLSVRMCWVWDLYFSLKRR